MEVNNHRAADPRSGLAAALASWIDSTAVPGDVGDMTGAGLHRRGLRAVDWPRVVPFAVLHLSCLVVIWTGVSTTAVVFAIAFYALRMFAVTAFYHRYFSHGAFRTSRAMQFVFALLGASAVQRGPLWWASHHRHHHAHADQSDDSHSLKQHGAFWSHMGWFMARENFAPRLQLVRSLSKYPELRFLDRYDALVPVVTFVTIYFVGVALHHWAPNLSVTGPQLFGWGFCISTVALYHATFTINSCAHKWGRRRYATRDDSRNNLWLALLTFGEGWHNNHHHYPAAARQGFYWWEIDVSWYGLKLLEALGLIWDLRGVPEARRNDWTLAKEGCA